MRFYQFYKNYPNITDQFNIILKKFKRDNLLDNLLE